MRILPSVAAHSSTSGSGVCGGCTSRMRMRSRFGSRRRRPRTRAPCKSSSAASGSMTWFLLVATRQQLGAQSGAIGLLTFDLLPQLCGLGLTLLEVGVHFVPVPQVIGYDGVDVGQVQRRVSIDDALRISAA